MKVFGLLAASVVTITALSVFVPIAPSQALSTPVDAPAPTRIAREGSSMKTAIFAGGCFWGVEGVFSHVKGVNSAEVGYHGGSAGTATYDRILAGGTAHAEAVRITYDPTVVSYDELLQIFFSVVADPTLRNRQGPDVGSHYRTALVPTSNEQREVAKAYLAQMEASGVWDRPIVTKIESERTFYRAESYHQDFMAKNPDHRYNLRWNKPKIAALNRMFPGDFTRTFLRDD